MKSIAIIGSGISGLGAAWFLHSDFDVTLFETEGRAGGHSNTISVVESGRSVPVDTGFMVFNRVTYPHLTRLFETLRVPLKPTDMSFSVSHAPDGLEYCGSSLNHLFAQRRNLLRPRFYRMLLAVDRFNREAVAALDDPAVRQQSLSAYVRERRYGEDFLHGYLLPMSSAVWSTPPEKMLRFPAATLLRFFHNHGFLGLNAQHAWWTVDGGAKAYVDRLLARLPGRVRLEEPVQRLARVSRGVEVTTARGSALFHHAIVACHPPDSLRLLGSGATADELRCLTPFHYQANSAVLHTDRSVMPRTRRAWASWNYRLDAPGARTSTHYWMNRLQGVSDQVDYFVSLNAESLIDPHRVIRTIPYEHPVFDREAVAAQELIPQLNRHAAGSTETYFAGAWQRYGFHEDGLLSAYQVAQLLLGREPWEGRP